MSHRIQKKKWGGRGAYPPIPDENELTVPIHSADAIAASTAFPPSFSISTPISEQSMNSVATAPCLATISVGPYVLGSFLFPNWKTRRDERMRGSSLTP